MPVDRAKMNKKMFAALKPGGFLVIADHSAKPGDGTTVAKTLHRIEESDAAPGNRGRRLQARGRGRFPASSRRSARRARCSIRSAGRRVRAEISEAAVKRRARLAWQRGNQIVLSVRNLTKTYRSAGEQVAVLRGVNLDVAAGERVALTGESGSGKSTLLHLIAGLDRRRRRRDQARRCRRHRPHRCRPRGAAARPARPGVPAVQPDPEPECRGQPRLPVAHRRPPRCRLAGRTGRAARARRPAEALSRAIVRRPAAAGRDRPRAWRQSRCCCSPTSRPAISTRRPPTTCWRWRAIWSREPAAAS